LLPFLTTPLALSAILAIPALVAIFPFPRRFRTRDVSSLVLWDAIRQPSAGGRTRERLRLPLPFWLEALASALLALAAAGPLLPKIARSRPLVIVCDDSLSMQLAREKAIAFARSEVARRGFSPVRVIFAGAAPRFASPDRIERQLAQWTCNAPRADIDAGIALAASAAGRGALVMVLTDHAPERPIDAGRIRWQAFGSALPNLGFVAATRAGDRVLLEIANDSASARSATLRVLRPSRVDVPAHSRRRVQLTLPPNTGPIEAVLGDDAAAWDNRVTLLPDRRRPLRVAVRIADPKLRESVEGALRATNRVTIDDVRHELLVSDSAGNEEWTIELQRGAGGVAFVGPYVVDRTHPLTAGVTLEGIVWGAARGRIDGQPVISIGDQPLLTETARHVRMRFDASISNLQRTPAWPSFWWNVVDWRSAHLPGPRRVNVTLGANATINVPGRATVIAPDGERRMADARDGSVVLAITQPGIWKVNEHSLAANALVPEETDLSHNVTGGWGTWDVESLASAGFENATWILLLAALAVLMFHQRVTRSALAS
jgi:hypothetical protein